MTDVYRTDLGGVQLAVRLRAAVERHVHRPLPGRRTPRTERRVVAHQQDADRRLSRLRPARVELRPGAAHRPAGPARSARDPVELRLQNMVAARGLPWRNTTGAVYDSGDYRACLQMAARRSATTSIAPPGAAHARTAATWGSGSHRSSSAPATPSAKFLAGRGSQFGAHESVTLRANRSGGVDLYTGVSTFGQGSETAFAQIVRRGHRNRVTTRSACTPATPAPRR